MDGNKKEGAPLRQTTVAELYNVHGTANTHGEYAIHIAVACDLINLAVQRGVLDAAARDMCIYDVQNAQNALEAMRATSDLTRTLYRMAIDYSDILYKHKSIDVKNYRMLKSNIARGPEFTTRDLEDADHIDAVGARAAAGLEAPGSAGKVILDGLINMNLRKKIHPEK